MADKTGIEWTDATWNPLAGCEWASPGCDNCYAAREAAGRLSSHPVYAGLAVRMPGEPESAGAHPTAKFTGEVRLLHDRLNQPLRWRRPRRIFVNSMSDLFHPDVPDDFIARVWAVMRMSPHHVFQVLTKRPQRMSRWVTAFNNDDPPLPNVWLGTSIESNEYAWRAKHLRNTPAAVRWVSAEPLIGPLDALDLTGIDWLVVGGESGPGARPMRPDWVRDLRDRAHPTPDEDCPSAPADDPGHCHHWGNCEPCCRCGDDTRDPSCDCPRCTAARVAFHFKQWGEWAPYIDAQADLGNDHPVFARAQAAVEDRTWPTILTAPVVDDALMIRVGKRNAGRTLDGRTWDEWPVNKDLTTGVKVGEDGHQ